MSPLLPKFTSLQWQFLATMAAFNNPVSLDAVGKLVQLPHGQFLELIRKCESLGWICQYDVNTFSLSNSLPDDVRFKLKKINPISSLNVNNPIVKDPPKASNNIPRKSENRERTLRDKIVMTIEVLQKGERDLARKHVKQIGSLLSLVNIKATSTENAWFIPESIRLAEYCSARNIELHIIIKILTTTIMIAEEVGDERSWAMANFMLGRACWLQGRTHDAVFYLGKGKDKAEELGDPDILTYAAWYIGYYYYIQGYMNKAAGYLKAVTQYAWKSEEYMLSYEAPILNLFCDINRGDFQRAIGTIDFFRQLAIKRQDYYTASVYRVLLGVGLCVIGKREEAIFHLESVQSNSQAADDIIGYWMSLHALSWLYLREGNIEKGFSLFKEALKMSGRAGIVYHIFHPIFLESYFNAEQAGCKLPPEWRFDSLFKKIMTEPNIDLQGVALRLRAVKSVASAKDESFIYKDLQDSEALLLKCEDSFQLAKTKMEKVRYYLRNNEHEKARGLANEVYSRELAGFSEVFFPDDLGFLLEGTKIEPVAAMDYETSREPLLQMLEELFTAPDEAMKMDLFLSTLSRFFRAERSGIFVFGDNGIELKTARNLSRSIIGDQNFQSSMELIVTCHKIKEPILSKNLRNTGGALYKGCLSAICLPILKEVDVKAVLYFDNSYLPNCFDFVSPAMLESLARQLSVILERQEIGIQHTIGSPIPANKAGVIIPAPSEFGGIDVIITDHKMVKLLNQAKHLAESDAPILILGETGAGKEVVAQWIHNRSSRNDKPFVIVDLTTISENLVESELFGHEKGAFTGAHRQKIGRIEIAEEGTLFFDEIGEISPQLQIKLLRLLEQKTFTRVGGTKTKKADFRLIAATNRNLLDEVKAGRFREDLYYRINALELTIPPLRERKSDIVALAHHFLAYYAKKYNKKVSRLTEDQLRTMKNYSWPGNIRELKHVIERAVLVSEEDRLDFNFSNQSECLPLEGFFANFPSLDEVQRRYIQFVLNHTGGKNSGTGGAAEILKMKRTSIISRMKKLGMR